MEINKGFYIDDLISYLGDLVISVKNGRNIEITDITNDSRDVVKDGAFIALKGTSVDANNYVESVLKTSPKLIITSSSKVIDQFTANYPKVTFVQFREHFDHLVLAKTAECFYHFPAKHLTLAGVTGTNGKTTTCYLVNHILRSAGRKTALFGTVSYDIDGEVFDATHTTPDPLQLQKYLAIALQKGVETVVMEVSSHAADQCRTGSAKFDAVGFTNLTGDHLDYHQSMQKYFDAKRSIFVNSLKSDGLAVINSDDEWGRKLSEFNNFSYSFDQITNYLITETGTEFTFDHLHIEVPLFGKFNVYNTLCAIGICRKLGVNDQRIVEALKQFKGVPGRLQAVHLNNGALAFVDYAHTDDALVNVGKALLELPHNRLITVFGCGGDRDRTKRPRMAKAAEQVSDTIIVTSDNSRTEDTKQIISDIVAGFESQTDYQVETDRAKAIAKAVSIAERGDIILVAGKGHEDYQIENGITHHFSDLEELQRFAK